MRNSNDGHVLVVAGEQNGVGKSLENEPSVLAFADGPGRELVRRSLDAQQSTAHSLQKLDTEARSPSFVPVHGLAEFRLRAR